MLLPNEVGVLKLRNDDMRAKYGKSIGGRGSCMSFEVCESGFLTHSVPFPRVGILGTECLVMSYFIVFLLFM